MPTQFRPMLLTRSGFYPKEDMMAGGERNMGRLMPMVLTGALAVLVGALLWGLTDISGGAMVALVILILAIGLAGVWMLDRRRVA